MRREERGKGRERRENEPIRFFGANGTPSSPSPLLIDNLTAFFGAGVAPAKLTGSGELGGQMEAEFR